MDLERKKKVLESLVKKLTKAKDFRHDCVLTSQEAQVAHEVLTETAVRISRIQAS